MTFKERAIAALEALVREPTNYYSHWTWFDGLRDAATILRALPDDETTDALELGAEVTFCGVPAIVDAVTFRRDCPEPRYEIVVPSDEDQRHYDLRADQLGGKELRR